MLNGGPVEHSFAKWGGDQKNYILKVEKDIHGRDRVVEQKRETLTQRVGVFFDRILNPDAYNIEKIEEVSTSIEDTDIGVTTYKDRLAGKVKSHDSKILARIESHPVITQIFHGGDIKRCFKKGEDFFNEGKFESASEYFRVLSKGLPEKDPRREACDAKYVICLLKKESKMTDEEVVYIAEALEKGSYHLKNIIVNILQDSKDYEIAERCLHGILIGYSTQPESTNKEQEMMMFQVRQGRSLQKLGRYGEAEEKFRDALKHEDFEKPDLKSFAYLNLQICLLKQDKLQEARILFETKLTGRMEWKNGSSRINQDQHQFLHGVCLRRLKEFDEAEDHLKRGYSTEGVQIAQDVVDRELDAWKRRDVVDLEIPEYLDVQ